MYIHRTSSPNQFTHRKAVPRHDEHGQKRNQPARPARSQTARRHARASSFHELEARTEGVVFSYVYSQFSAVLPALVPFFHSLFGIPPFSFLLFGEMGRAGYMTVDTVPRYRNKRRLRQAQEGLAREAEEGLGPVDAGACFGQRGGREGGPVPGGHCDAAGED